jgi:predicted RNase H-like HicB family nuclease
MARPKRYTITDGKLLLTLEEAEEGGYVVTSPVDPELITEAETIPQAFEMARDAIAVLTKSRRKLYAEFAAARRRSARSA